MAINISTRNYRFLVNAKDYTAALVESTNWATNSIDQTGLVKTTASFTLAEVRVLPGSLDDRVSTDWNIGQSVRILVADSTGVLRPHPCGALRILSSSWDYETRRTQVNCGCLISLLSFKAPTNPKKLDLEQAKLTSRSAIALELLRLAGITAITGLNDLPYSLYYPFDISGSYLECCGKILYACLRFGRIDSNEVFRVEPITLNNPVSLQWQIGGDAGDELWYRRLNNAESPREVIEVRGSRQVGEIPKYPIISSSERYGQAKFIDPALDAGGITIYEQSRITESFGGSRLTKTESKSEPVGLIIPNAKSVFKTTLINSYREETTYAYENNEEGKLRSIKTEIYRPIGQLLKEFYDYLDSTGVSYSNEGLILAEIVNTDYGYDSKDRTRLVSTTIYKTVGELLSGIDTDWSYTLGIPPTGLRISEVNEESWVRQSTGFWIHRINNYKTAAVVNPGYFSSQEKPENMSDETFEDNQRAQQLSLVPDSNASLFERSNSGQTVPPSAERCPVDVSLASESVCGKAIFSLYGGNPYKEKERSYSVEFLGDRKRGINEDTGEEIIEDEEPCDNAQARAIAQFEGAMLAGRFKGQDIGVNLKNELFDWRPLQVLDCTEPDGTIRRYALDDSHWYIGQNRAIANFGCIWLGDVQQGNLAKPYTIAHIFTGTEVIGGDILVYPYSLFPIPYSLFGGEVIGGNILSLNTLQPGQVGIRGGEVIGGSINITTIIKLPDISITGGVIFGGAIISYLSAASRQSPFRGGITYGGNIEVINTLAPGQIAIRGGEVVGGRIEIYIIVSLPLVNLSGGETIGGIIKTLFTLKLSGGIVEGGNIIIGSAIASSWNNLDSNDWNTLTNNNWNSLN
ncbi:MAG: hypothetical protein ACRCZS_08775 [Chroococcidiopsis sp.]